MIHSFLQVGSAFGWQDVLSGGSFQEGQAGKGCQPNTSSEAREQVITPKSSHLMRPSEVHRLSSLYHPFGDQQYSSVLDGGGQTDGLYMKGPRRTHVLNVWSPQQMDPTIEGDWMIYFTSGQIHWQTPTERNTRCEVTQIIAGCVIWRVCLSQASCSFYFLAVVEWTPHRVLCRSGLLRHSGLLCHRSRNNGVMYYELKFLKLQLKISLLSNNYHSHKKQTNKTA